MCVLQSLFVRLGKYCSPNFLLRCLGLLNPMYFKYWSERSLLLCVPLAHILFLLAPVLLPLNAYSIPLPQSLMLCPAFLLQGGNLCLQRGMENEEEGRARTKENTDEMQ